MFFKGPSKPIILWYAFKTKTFWLCQSHSKQGFEGCVNDTDTWAADLLGYVDKAETSEAARAFTPSSKVHESNVLPSETKTASSIN